MVPFVRGSGRNVCLAGVGRGRRLSVFAHAYLWPSWAKYFAAGCHPWMFSVFSCPLRRLCDAIFFMVASVSAAAFAGCVLTCFCGIQEGPQMLVRRCCLVAWSIALLLLWIDCQSIRMRPVGEILIMSERIGCVGRDTVVTAFFRGRWCCPLVPCCCRLCSRTREQVIEILVTIGICAERRQRVPELAQAVLVAGFCTPSVEMSMPVMEAEQKGLTLGTVEGSYCLEPAARSNLRVT